MADLRFDASVNESNSRLAEYLSAITPISVAPPNHPWRSPPTDPQRPRANQRRTQGVNCNEMLSLPPMMAGPVHVSIEPRIRTTHYAWIPAPKLTARTLPRAAQVLYGRRTLPVHRPKRAISAAASPAITSASLSQLPFALQEAPAPLCTCSHRARLLRDSALESIQNRRCSNSLPPVGAAGWFSGKREWRCRADRSQDARPRLFIL
jgi:hypothetical protein